MLSSINKKPLQNGKPTMQHKHWHSRISNKQPQPLLPQQPLGSKGQIHITNNSFGMLTTMAKMLRGSTMELGRPLLVHLIHMESTLLESPPHLPNRRQLLQQHQLQLLLSLRLKLLTSNRSRVSPLKNKGRKKVACEKYQIYQHG